MQGCREVRRRGTRGLGEPVGGVLDRAAEHLRLVRVRQGSARDLLDRLPPQPLGVDERSVHVEQDGLERELGVGGHVSLFHCGFTTGRWALRVDAFCHEDRPLRQRHAYGDSGAQGGGLVRGQVGLDLGAVAESYADADDRAEERGADDTRVSGLVGVHMDRLGPYEHVDFGSCRCLAVDRQPLAEHVDDPVRELPWSRLIVPTNSATNAVAGRPYNSAGAAHCSSFPARITATRSAMDRASS